MAEGADMLAEYLGVAIILAISIVLIGMLRVAQWRLAPRRIRPTSSAIFSRRVAEPGRQTSQDDEAARRHALPRGRPKFHRVALLFVVVNAQLAYFYPWGATFREVGLPGLIVIGLFSVPLLVGWAYAWARGALDW